MNRSLGAVVTLLLFALLGCQLQPPAVTPTSLVTAPTLTALKPTATPTITPTPSTTPTPTLSPTVGPSPTPSPTSTATATPLPPTPTPNPAYADFSYCGGPFGKRIGERFSAQLQEVAVERQASMERLTMRFKQGEGEIHGIAHCLLTGSSRVLTTTNTISAVLRLELPDWEHDQLFEESREVLSRPIPISGTQVVRTAALYADEDNSAGLVVELGLTQPVPFQARVSGDTITIEIADAPQVPYGYDPLEHEEGTPATLSSPLFAIQNGDIWHINRSEAKPLTTSTELETAVTASSDGKLLAFCRATSPETAALGSLWVSNSDGTKARQLADVGGCADPAFTPDGQRVYFVAPVAPTPPLVYQLWSVPVAGGTAEPVSSLDEWSRRHPQPLDDGSIVSLGRASLGRTTVLLDRPNGMSHELSAELLGLGAYSGIGTVLLAPDGRSIAVEALRITGGADLALIDLNGHLQTTIGEDAYWNRPLAWAADGTLFYLRAACASGLVLQYELYARNGNQDQLIVTGTMSEDIGAATAVDSQLALVRQPPLPSDLRGPRPAPVGPASVWLVSSGGRVQLHSSQGPISNLVR